MSANENIAYKLINHYTAYKYLSKVIYFLHYKSSFSI